MALYDNIAPAAENRDGVHPTLLVSWWCTIYALVIIIARVAGRWTRTRRLLSEDIITLLSTVPLFARIALTHQVLLLGTNNASDLGILAETAAQRRLGSQLVLPARICFLTYLWFTKIAALEVIRKIVGVASTVSYRTAIRSSYSMLGMTYVAVTISTLAECRPFAAYWQVVPDPGPQCRQSSAQLLCMGIADSLTDLAIIALPAPLILTTNLSRARRALLIVLFSLPLATIAVTLFRIPTTLERKGAQPYRSLMASVQILVATGVTNAIAIGSLVRDKGPRRTKYRGTAIELVSDPDQRQRGLEKLKHQRTL